MKYAISSLVPKLINTNYDKKLKDLQIDLNKSIDESQLNNFRDHLKQIFINKGDKGLKGFETGFAELLSNTFVKITEVRNKIKNPIDALAALGNINNKYLNKNMKLKDAIVKIEYIKKMKQVSLKLKRELDEILTIPEKILLSWKIEKAFQEKLHEILFKDKYRKAEASSINDKHLASFAIYFHTFVDKRTNDILDLLSKNNKIKYLRYSKIRNIEDLENFINEFSIQY